MKSPKSVELTEDKAHIVSIWGQGLRIHASLNTLHKSDEVDQRDSLPK